MPIITMYVNRFYSFHTIMEIIVGYLTATLFNLFFRCKSIGMGYNVLIMAKSQINALILHWYYHGGLQYLSTVSDLIIFVLLMPMIAKLQINEEQSTGLLFIFGTCSL